MKISATIRRYVFFVLLAGIFVWLLCIIFHPFEQPEPRYQGKNLTDWAEEIDQGAFFARTTDPSHQEQSELAISAIRHIGTNALPVVLKLCRAKDSWFKKHLEGWAERYNFSDWPKQRRFPIYIKSADEKNFEGDNIIWALGSVAKPAIPELIRLLQSRDREIAESAMTALPGIGTNAIPPLLHFLTAAIRRFVCGRHLTWQTSSGQKHRLLPADHWSWPEVILLGRKPVPLFRCCFNAWKTGNWIKLPLSAPFIPLA